MPAWLELLITGPLIALLMLACFKLGQVVALRRLATDMRTANIHLYRRAEGSQTLFRLSLGTFFDSGWRPVPEHIMPDDAPDPDPDTDLSDS